MSLGLERDNGLDILDYKIVGDRVIGRCELLYNGTLSECHIILVCRNDAVAVLVGRTFDHSKQ